MEEARVARPEDVDRLVELAATARAELVEQRGGFLWSRRESPPEPRRTELAAAIADPAACLTVGSFADHAVGYGLARLEELRTGEVIAVVSDIYVEPAFRGVAVGEAVMDALIAWARQQGCIGIDSLVLPGMRDSKNFFERYGMKARALLVHKSFLEPAPTAGPDR